MALLVQKYGGTSVGSPERIKNVAARVKRSVQAGHQVVVVVSAMSGETNRLIALAKETSPSPSPRELDVVISTGEQVTIGLLCMALGDIGVPARSYTGGQVKVLTDSTFTKARILNIDDAAMRKDLNEGRVVVVAGFQGATEYGDITTLGRGGSDTTAVAIAAKLNYQCHIFTDVAGVYTIDPRLYTRAKKLKSISYEEMMQMACLGAGVLETRSVELASKYNVPLFLGKALETDLEKGTWIMHKELEDMPITGLSVKDDYAIMRFMHLPNDGVYLGKLFKMISDLNINLDTISQQLDDEGLANFTLYCSEEQSNQIMENASKEYPVHQMLGYIKLSLVGLGISTHSGIASKVLNILSENGIKYYMITSSEISISLTIEKKDKVKAVQALGKAFDL